MPEQYVLQEPPHSPVPEQVPKQKIPKNLLIAGATTLVLIVLFIGIFLGSVLSRPKQAVVEPPTPTPTLAMPPDEALTPTPVSEVPHIKFLPNKQYFDDTYVVTQKGSPHKTLVLGVSRIQQENNFIEYTKVNYFNGLTWDRKTVTTTLQSGQVTTNSLLREWNEPDQQDMGSPKNLSSVELPLTTLEFTSTDLQNEISIQSLPGSTKFIYQGKGTLIVNDDPFEAYVFRSRTYSFNASDLSFLTQPEILTSNWLLFWDTDGTFYYSDSHQVPDKKNPIQNFQIGVKEDNARKVERTTQITSSIFTDRTTTLYQAFYNDPINERISIPLQYTLNKADKRSYTWTLSVTQGQAVKKEGRSVSGVGVVEYIRPASN